MLSIHEGRRLLLKGNALFLPASKCFSKLRADVVIYL